MRRAARAVGRAEPLGHYAFTTEFAGVFKENVPVAFKDFVKHNAGVRPAHQFCQLALALLDGHTPQILALKFDEIKSEEHRVSAVTLVADQIEHRQATLIGHDGFAVEHERM